MAWTAWLTKDKDPLDVVEAAFRKRSLKYQRLDDDTVLAAFGMGGGSCMVRISHDRRTRTAMFLFSALARDTGPSFPSGLLCVHPRAGHTPAQVASVCQFLLKKNYDLVLGAFERND